MRVRVSPAAHYTTNLKKYMALNINLNTLRKGSGTKRQKFGLGSLIFVILFGTIFAAAGLWFINDSKIDPSWTQISGQIVDSARSTNSKDNTTYRAIVSYSVNGQPYTVTSRVGSSASPTTGTSRQVAYNPSKPSEAKVVEAASMQMWMWLFPVAGFGLIIFAIVSFIKSTRRTQVINTLMQTGQKITGVLTDIQSSGSDKNQTYKIVVSATDLTGTVRNYTSDSLTNVGGLKLVDFHSNPVPIDVYIDSSNPEHYYVDIFDIPNLSPQRILDLIQSVKK